MEIAQAFPRGVPLEEGRSGGAARAGRAHGARPRARQEGPASIWLRPCQDSGARGASAPVGPAVERIGTRAFIAGLLPKTPENMVGSLRHPQTLNPRSAMPDHGVSEPDTRGIAAYLSTLR
jgi:hypothetical protein